MEYYENRGGFFSRIPKVTKNLILINLIVWIACFIMYKRGSTTMIEQFALFYPGSALFHFWQPVTHMFMHDWQSIWHLFFNMYTLLIFGCVLERVWGPKKFLLFYFVCGLGAAACHCGVQWAQASYYLSQISLDKRETAIQVAYYLRQNPGDLACLSQFVDPEPVIKYSQLLVPTVGASGAIYGILIGYAMLYPDSRLTLIFPPISLTAKWWVIIFAAIEIVTGIFSLGGGIAHFAHLGGMVFGLIMIFIWKRNHTLYGNYD